MDSATVFGVSTESMQLSYDPRGNSIPTILLLLQRHLYSQRGLQVCHVSVIFGCTALNFKPLCTNTSNTGNISLIAVYFRHRATLTGQILLMCRLRAFSD